MICSIDEHRNLCARFLCGGYRADGAPPPPSNYEHYTISVSICRPWAIRFLVMQQFIDSCEKTLTTTYIFSSMPNFFPCPSRLIILNKWHKKMFIEKSIVFFMASATFYIRVGIHIYVELRISWRKTQSKQWIGQQLDVSLNNSEPQPVKVIVSLWSNCVRRTKTKKNPKQSKQNTQKSEMKWNNSTVTTCGTVAASAIASPCTEYGACGSFANK